MNLHIYIEIYILQRPGKDCYSADPRVWNAIFDKIATDWQDMEQNGIELDHQGHITPVILGNKGDWSYLVPRHSKSVKRCSLGAFCLHVNFTYTKCSRNNILSYIYIFHIEL